MSTDNISASVAASTTESPRPTVNVSRPKLPFWRRILKVSAWVILGVTLFIVGLLYGTISILYPERLTPLVTDVANNNLNADVSIGRVELKLRPTFPYLEVNVSDVTVVSRTVKALDAETHEYLPQWVDTVMTFKSFRGGINIMNLAANKLDFSDIVLDRPSINLAVVDDELTNYDIFKPTEEDTTKFDFTTLPTIKLSRLEVTNPQPIRYYNSMTGGEIAVNLRPISLDATKSPLYKLDFGGDVDAPEMLSLFNLEDLAFGLKGDITWSQEKPYELTLNNFAFDMAMIGGIISTSVDFANALTINSLDVTFKPLDIKQLLRTVPDPEMLVEIGLPADLPETLDTDAKVTVAMRLLEPYNTETSLPPHLVADITIPDSYVRYQQIDLNTLALNATVTIPSDNLDQATVKINKLNLVGPATDVHITGTTLTNLISDPTFESDFNIDTDLKHLPMPIKRMFDGYISGRVTAEVNIRGSASMFTPKRFQYLTVKGDVGLHDIYWVSSDTVNMAYVGRASFKFDTQRIFKRDGTSSRPFLSAGIKIDTCLIEHGTYNFRIRDFSIGMACLNEYNADTTAVRPMGGGLKVGYFNFTSLTDSATVRVRDLNGFASARLVNGDTHRPDFTIKAKAGHISAGDNTTRMMVSNANVNFNTSKKEMSRREKRLRHIADSLAVHYPNLPPDSIYARALYEHRLHRKPYPRVHPVQESDGTEIIDWGASRGFAHWLNNWHISGSITSKRARLFSPYFPLRNRVRNLNVTFNNDTIRITNLQFKAGHSDLTLSGMVTNLRRSITSNTGRQPIKVRLGSLSDTIDVNQLTTGVFAGSAYAAARERGQAMTLSNIDDEARLDSIITTGVIAPADSTGPLLVPVNVDAEIKMTANNVLYSDLNLHDMKGSLLAYDGAINLHDLSASSNFGSINLSALYMGHQVDKLSFGFGVQLNNFNIHRFLTLVPAVDSLMPVLRDFSGIISADIAATSPVTPSMELQLDKINAAIELSGDSLVLIDPATFKSVAKWLLFKDKNRNIIDHMRMQMIIRDGLMTVYPFIFDFDRYRLGVQGYNDFALNFKYHIAVLKSPIPFKFGINLSGDPDKIKVRLGGAKFKNLDEAEAKFVDRTRVSLLKQIQGVFVRGVRSARMASLKLDSVPEAAKIELDIDTLTAADSARFIKEGLLPAPPPPVNDATNTKKDKRDKSKRDRSNR